MKLTEFNRSNILGSTSKYIYIYIYIYLVYCSNREKLNQFKFGFVADWDENKITGLVLSDLM